MTTSYFATDPTEVKISVSAVVTRQEKPGEILLMRRSDNEHWGLPGGYVEPGESVVAATEREVRRAGGGFTPADPREWSEVLQRIADPANEPPRRHRKQGGGGGRRRRR